MPNWLSSTAATTAGSLVKSGVAVGARVGLGVAGLGVAGPGVDSRVVAGAGVDGRAVAGSGVASTTVAAGVTVGDDAPISGVGVWTMAAVSVNALLGDRGETAERTTRTPRTAKTLTAQWAFAVRRWFRSTAATSS